ncbi:MAG: YkvA family protein [Halanaerobiales bacterium]
MGKSIYNLVRIIRFLRDDEVNISKKLLVLIPFIYFLSPIDMFSDFAFPIVGYLDDVAVFVLMWPILKSLLSKYSSGREPDTGKGFKKKKYKEAIDIDKDDYEVK